MAESSEGSISPAESTAQIILDRFLAWSQRSDNVQAVLLIGSQARRIRPADPWSDHDLVVIVLNTEQFLEQLDWIEAIGTPWLTFIEMTKVKGIRERRALWAGGIDFDFIPISVEHVSRLLETPPTALQSASAETDGNANGFRSIFRNGVQFLLDKVNLQDGLGRLAAEVPAPSALEEKAFQEAIQDFLFHAVWTVKKIRRGEIWSAKACCDGYMKRLLLTMIEWNARVHHSAEYDVWYDGRFIEKWADPEAVKELRGTFAHYDAREIVTCVITSMNLFRRLAKEVAQHRDFVYPAEADRNVLQWIVNCLDEGGITTMSSLTDTP